MIPRQKKSFRQSPLPAAFRSGARGSGAIFQSRRDASATPHSLMETKRLQKRRRPAASPGKQRARAHACSRNESPLTNAPSSSSSSSSSAAAARNPENLGRRVGRSKSAHFFLCPITGAAGDSDDDVDDDVDGGQHPREERVLTTHDDRYIGR